MGNRAVITASKTRNSGIGIYLHWNGGLESVLAFLDTCKARNYRDPSGDESYAMARLCQVVCEFFGEGLSVGIGEMLTLDCDNWDNGVYVIGKGWEITDRWGSGSEPCLPTRVRQARKEEQYKGILDQLSAKTPA